MKLRELLQKINDAIRPAHVGELGPTDVAERGGTEDTRTYPGLGVHSQQDEAPQ